MINDSVWIVMYTEEETGIASIKGIFPTEQKAKLFIADYALNNDIDSSYLELGERVFTE